jgi:adenosine deaminase
MSSLAPGRLDVVALPKVQLHCHLEGTIRAATFRELAILHGVDIGARGSGPIERTYDFATFRDFLLTFADVCKALQSPADFERLALEYVDEAREHNVRYAELFVSPSVWSYFHRNIDVRACFAAMRDVFASPESPSVRFICDLTRNFGVERAQIAVSLMDLGVIGVGLGGDEANYPPELYESCFAYARANGLRTVAHAGEAAGPDSVRAAIDVLGAERIGHGVRSIEDPRLVAELAQRRIPLEICPTSNRLTGAAPAGRPHPIADLAAAGVVCTIDADDPTLFSTNVSREYEIVAGLLGDDAIIGFARNAIDASFAEKSARQTLETELAAFVAGRE